MVDNAVVEIYGEGIVHSAVLKMRSMVRGQLQLFEIRGEE